MQSRGPQGTRANESGPVRLVPRGRRSPSSPQTRPPGGASLHVVALLFTGLLGNKFGGLLQGVGQQPALLPNAVVVKIGAPLFAAALPLAQGRVIHIVYLCVFRVADVLLRLEAGAIGDPQVGSHCVLRLHHGHVTLRKHSLGARQEGALEEDEFLRGQ